jgi:hypothetical protein
MILIADSNQLWQARKTIITIWKLEIMTPLGNSNLNKIFEKIAHIFMKLNCGQGFHTVKRCSIFIVIKHYKLNKEVSSIGAHGKGEEVDVPRLMFNGIFT